MQDFRNVDAWAKAHPLVLRVHEESARMPNEQAFGVAFQLRRSAIAIPTRIAEGCGRSSNAEFAADLKRSIASCNELEYLILLARDLRLWKPECSDELMARTVEVRKMTYGFLRTL